MGTGLIGTVIGRQHHPFGWRDTTVLAELHHLGPVARNGSLRQRLALLFLGQAHGGATLVQQRQGTHRRRRITAQENARIPKILEQRRLDRFSDDAQKHRHFARQRFEGFRIRDQMTAHGGSELNDDCFSPGVRHDGLAGVLQHAWDRIDLAGQVDGVCLASERRQYGVEFLDRGRVELSHGDVALAAVVGQQSTGAARCAQYRNTALEVLAVTRIPQEGQNLDGIDQFGNAIDLDDAGLLEDSGIHRMRRGDLSGMGGRRIQTDGRPTCLQGDDLHAAFTGPLSDSQHAARIVQPFQVERNHPDIVLLDDRIGCIEHVETGLVANADDVGQAHAGVVQRVADGARQCAALAEHGHRGMVDLLDVECRAAEGHDGLLPDGPETIAVRSHHRNAIFACRLGQRTRVLLASFDFLETGTEHHRIANALLAALRDHTGNGVRRCEHQRDIGYFGQLTHGLVSLQPLDLRVAGGDRVDGALKSVLQKVFHERVARRAGLRRRANDGNTPGLEESGKSSLLSHVCVSVHPQGACLHWPLNRGVRFSLKAASASWWSSLARTMGMVEATMSSAVPRSLSRPKRTTRLIACTASGAASATLRAKA
ncbi:hypothetical protein D3C87_1174020 [compost metagenome]